MTEDPTDADPRPIISRTGMTTGRFREISQAAKEGSPFELSTEEQAQYDAASQAITEAMSKNQVNWEKVLKPLGEMRKTQTKDLLAAAEAASKADSWPSQMRRISDPRIGHESENAQNIRVTAEAMAEMLEVMKSDREDAERRDKHARKSARSALWIGIASTTFAALALIAPFVIEAIKGWK